MRTIRAALALAVGLGCALLGGTPATAGGWAVTSLDPLPERVEPGRAYTVGFWVLQHGSHPYEGAMDPVGLRFADERGQVVEAPGVALKEPAHYAAAVSLPRAGTWNVYGVQGPFLDYKVGTLTVPGGFRSLPVPRALPFPEAGKLWGPVRPPVVATDPFRDPYAEPAAAAIAPKAPAPARDDRGGFPVGLAVAAGVLVLGAGLAWRSWPVWYGAPSRRRAQPRRDLVG
jgi:hypothetical protein